MCLAIAIPPLIILAALAGFVWFLSGKLIERRKPDPADDPARYGLVHEEVSFLARDGLMLGGWWIPGTDPAKTVVLCHGQRGSMDGDLPLAAEIVKAGFNVLMFDFRAHGRSEGRHVSMGMFERKDLQGALDFLESRGIERIGVLGFSMGGTVAILTAALDPRIMAVVSDGGPVRPESAIAGWWSARGIPYPLAKLLAKAILALASARLGGANLSHADLTLWADDLEGTATLLIHGENDPLVPDEEINLLYELLPEPKSLWIAPAAGHREAAHMHREEYLRRVTDWFSLHLA